MELGHDGGVALTFLSSGVNGCALAVPGLESTKREVFANRSFILFGD